jgi:hypothetical protein
MDGSFFTTLLKTAIADQNENSDFISQRWTSDFPQRLGPPIPAFSGILSGIGRTEEFIQVDN